MARTRAVSDLDLATLTLVDALEGLDTGAYTSAELTLAYLERIAVYEDTYNAFTFLNPGALDDASDSDARRAAGLPPRAMEGIPVVIKEVCCNCRVCALCGERDAAHNLAVTITKSRPGSPVLADLTRSRHTRCLCAGVER